MIRGRSQLLAVLFCVALVGGCSGVRNTEYATLSGVPWNDRSVFLAGAADRDLFAAYPNLETAPSYHIRIDLADDLDSADCSMSVRYRTGDRQHAGTLDFLLLANQSPGAMEVQEITVDGAPARFELMDESTMVRVDLPDRSPGPTETYISIHYRLNDLGSRKAGFGGFGRSGEVVALAYAYPVIPAQNPWDLGRPAVWGDITANPQAFYVVEVSYPSTLVLAAPGTELHRARRANRTTTLIAHGPARDFAFALSADFQYWERAYGGTRIRLFARNTNDQTAESVLRDAGAAVEIFGRSFAPYPYDSLTFVASRLDALGLEFPGFVILAPWLTENSGSASRVARVKTLLEATIAHETAHQWFYALVGNNQLQQPWIDEGLAQYATWMYYQERYGPGAGRNILDSFSKRWQRVADRNIPIGRPVRSYTPQEYSAIVYGRAPLFFMALNERMGPIAFDAFLAALTHDYGFREITGLDVKLEAEAACGCLLDDIWKKWVDG